MRTHLLFLLVLLVPSIAVAADPDRRAKVMEKIETIRIGKLTEALELDSKSAEKVFPILRPFNERRRTAQAERWEAMHAITDQLDSEKPDEKAIAALLEDAMKANRELADIAEDEYAALKPVLDPVVLARYYRFQVDFERRIGELIREIRGEEKQGKDKKQKAIERQR